MALKLFLDKSKKNNPLNSSGNDHLGRKAYFYVNNRL
jgi:hypothetical protein